MKTKVRKAVFPAAGFGTRFLPATKAIPKEMLAVVDKPIIQYGVEEALAAGCEEIIIITRAASPPSKTTSTSATSSKPRSKSAAKPSCSTIARKVSNMAQLSYVRQKEAKGLGHAVLMAKELGGR